MPLCVSSTRGVLRTENVPSTVHPPQCPLRCWRTGVVALLVARVQDDHWSARGSWLLHTWEDARLERYEKHYEERHSWWCGAQPLPEQMEVWVRRVRDEHALLRMLLPLSWRPYPPLSKLYQARERWRGGQRSGPRPLVLVLFPSACPLSVFFCSVIFRSVLFCSVLFRSVLFPSSFALSSFAPSSFAPSLPAWASREAPTFPSHELSPPSRPRSGSCFFCSSSSDSRFSSSDLR